MIWTEYIASQLGSTSGSDGIEVHVDSTGLYVTRKYRNVIKVTKVPLLFLSLSSISSFGLLTANHNSSNLKGA
jgi:hypothetical protein